MNALQEFTFDQQNIRTLLIDENPYFIGKDVAQILGYKNTKDALAKHVDPEDKLGSQIATSGQNREMTVINESGLYSLILSSKLPTAKRFKRWVTSEVLPALRKHGAYATGETIDRIISDPDYGIQLLQTLKEERQKRKELEEANQIQQIQIAELQPKASYYDVILNCKDLVSITKIAKDYGMSGQKLNNLLHEKKVQFKQGAIWLPYQNYAEKGYTSTKTHTYLGNDGETHSKQSMYWTQKGRIFIYELLKKDGILPTIERDQEEKEKRKNDA